MATMPVLMIDAYRFWLIYLVFAVVLKFVLNYALPL
jgi:hypothetical protein